MTVSSTTNTNSYTTVNATTHSFAYGFKIFADADLEVIVRSAAGAETVKTLGTHFVVTNAGTDSGGNVLFKYNTGTSSDAHFSSTDYRPASGETVLLRRNLSLTQGTDYIENDTFSSNAHENALDRLTFITQALQEQSDRSIKISKTNTITSSEFTTSATNRANKLLAFNASGEIAIDQEIGTFKGNSATTTTAAFIVRDIVKATTTAQLNNIYICVAASAIGDVLTDTDHFALIVDAVSAAASATTATTKASEASTSAGTATTKAGEAATSATNAAATLTTFTRQYHGASGSNPTANLDAGDLYFKTDGSGMKVYTGSAWADVKPTSSEQTNINTVAGANSNISALAASAVITDMGLLATDAVIADMAQLANSTIIDDLAILATSDIVTDLAILATSANVTAMGLLATSANVTAQGLLGTAAVVEDMGLLGVAAVIEDMALLGVAGVIEDMGILGTSANVTAMSNVSGSIANVNTVATNIASVNNFSDVYRIASSAPSSSLTAGDLYFNTSTNVLNVYGASGWQNAGSSVNGTSQRYHYDIGSAVTSVTGSDASSNTLAYDAGYVDVYVNGVRMSTADVTVTSGDTVTFASALASGDEVDIVAYGTFAVANIVSTGALNSGSITSGFGTINTGSSSITTTGVGSFGSLDISGDIDVDGTTNLDVVDIDGAVDMASTLNVTGATTLAASTNVVTPFNIRNTTQSFNGGLSTEVNTSIINFGLNEGSSNRFGGSYTQASQGGMLTFDIRSGSPLFKIYAREAGTASASGTAALTILSSGNTGIGTSSPTHKISIEGTADNVNSQLKITASGVASGGIGVNSTGMFLGCDKADGVIAFRTATTGGGSFTNTGTESLRITAAGRISIGTTTETAKVSVYQAGNSLNLMRLQNTNSGNSCTMLQFANSASASCGLISQTGATTVAYTTSSDYRLKENVSYDFNATTRLKQLKPARFNFIQDGTDKVVDGFLAHEVQAIVPEAITGTKDAVDADGNAVMQGIDQSKIVPLLVKTIQELEARITALENGA